jgi:DNA-binding response OmpR family regulator
MSIMNRSISRVLVADDNAVDRKLLAKIAGNAGFEVVEAVDGNDAVEKYYSEKPDLVLLDALMPGRDGFSVAREIKSHDTDEFVPIIFLTSLTEAQDLARCVEAGGDDFLSKPYNHVVLQAKLRAMQRMRETNQTVQLQRDEIARHHMQLVADQEAAKAVFDNVAHTRNLETSYIKYLLSPLAMFNGDVLLAAQNPAKSVYVLLGDFTGHGLAAAIGTMPLADVFYSMTAKGFTLSQIIKECNRKLGSVLPPGYFCCATALMLDFNRSTVEVWNGGVPSAYLRKSASEEIRLLASNHLPLGISAGDKFDDATLVYEVELGDRLFLATDGVIESRNSVGEYFGSDKLEAIISSASPHDLFDSVQRAVNGFVDEEGRDDDITMVEIAVVTPDQVEAAEIIDDVEALGGPRDWKFRYELGPQSLKEFNPLPLLQQVLMGAPYLRARATAIYAVLAELYSNALEHGVLGLRSEMKSSAEGFSAYYAARVRALECVQGFVRFDFNCELLDDEVELSISVTDSGRGFDHENYLRRAKNAVDAATGYHGRGIRLLWDLCSSVRYVGSGNQIEVAMHWNVNDE